MVTPRTAVSIILFAFACLQVSPAFAEIVLLNGSHRTVVWDIDGTESDSLNDNTFGVQFDGTASADHLMLSADGVFSTFFDTDLLVFSLESTHSVLQTTQEPPSELFSKAGSTFWFTTDMEVEVSVHGSMSFDLGVADSESAIILEILDGNQDRIYQNVLGSFTGPGVGMFLFDDSIVLEDGTYFVQVNSNLIAFSDRNPGPVSTASGEIAGVISTVPEPTSLVLLCCGTLLVRRRGRGGYALAYLLSR